MNTTFFYETGVRFSNGSLSVCVAVLLDEQGVLFWLGKGRANFADLNLHELIHVREHWTDGWPVFCMLMFSDQHDLTLGLHFP